MFAVLVALADGGPGIALIALGIVLGVQFLEGNFLQPIIQSRTVDLHPAVILLAVAAGGSLFGILGAYLAVPVTAVAFAVAAALRAEEARPCRRRRFRPRTARSRCPRRRFPSPARSSSRSGPRRRRRGRDRCGRRRRRSSPPRRRGCRRGRRRRAVVAPPVQRGSFACSASSHGPLTSSPVSVVPVVSVVSVVSVVPVVSVVRALGRPGRAGRVEGRDRARARRVVVGVSASSRPPLRPRRSAPRSLLPAACSCSSPSVARRSRRHRARERP